MMTATKEWKATKEAFVTGLTGGSALEVTMVVAVAQAATVLLSRVIAKAIKTTKKTSTNTFPAASASASAVMVTMMTLLCEWSATILPMLLVTTLLADHAVIAAVTLLFGSGSIALFFFSNNSNSNSSSVHRNTIDTPKTTNSLRFEALTELRAALALTTAYAILAVDFAVFPRRFAKTEQRGFSVMDCGVGAFVLCSGLSRGVATLVQRQQTARRDSSNRNIPWRAALVLAGLGIARLVAVKASGYPEHVGEYGVHWNFFLTLAVTTLVAGILSTSKPKTTQLWWIGGDAVAAAVIAGLHQITLTAGVSDWVFANVRNEIVGLKWIPMPIAVTRLIEANREGICSLPGYISLVLLGGALGKAVFVQYKQSRWRAAGISIGCAIAAQCGVLLIGETPSRVLVDLPYILHSTSVMMMLLSLLLCTRVVFPQLDVLSNVVEGASNNMLAVFLFANVLTGAVNFAINTATVSTTVAFLILVLYTFFISAFAFHCGRRNLRLFHF